MTPPKSPNSSADDKDPAARGRFFGGMLATFIVTFLASNGTTCAQTNQVERTATRRAEKQATEKTAEIDARVQNLYNNSLKPVIDGLVTDVKECHETQAELEEHLLKYAEMKGRVDAIEGFERARYGRRYEDRRKEEVEDAVSKVKPVAKARKPLKSLEALEKVHSQVLIIEEDTGEMSSAAHFVEDTEPDFGIEFETHQLQLPAYEDLE